MKIQNFFYLTQEQCLGLKLHIGEEKIISKINYSGLLQATITTRTRQWQKITGKHYVIDNAERGEYSNTDWQLSHIIYIKDIMTNPLLPESYLKTEWNILV